MHCMRGERKKIIYMKHSMYARFFKEKEKIKRLTFFCYLLGSAKRMKLKEESKSANIFQYVIL